MTVLRRNRDHAEQRPGRAERRVCAPPHLRLSSRSATLRRWWVSGLRPACSGQTVGEASNQRVVGHEGPFENKLDDHVPGTHQERHDSAFAWRAAAHTYAAFRMAADACPEGMAGMAEQVMAGDGRRLERALASERQRGSELAQAFRPGGSSSARREASAGVRTSSGPGGVMSTATPKSHSSTIDQTCLSAAAAGSELTEIRRARPAVSSQTSAGIRLSARYGPEDRPPPGNAASAGPGQRCGVTRRPGPRTASGPISTASSLPCPNRASRRPERFIRPERAAGSVRDASPRRACRNRRRAS